MADRLREANATLFCKTQAQQQGDGDKLRVMMHISTVMQEEHGISTSADPPTTTSSFYPPPQEDIRPDLTTVLVRHGM